MFIFAVKCTFSSAVCFGLRLGLDVCIGVYHMHGDDEYQYITVKTANEDQKKRQLAKSNSM